MPPWEDLAAIARANDDEQRRLRGEPLIECPVHKYPLEDGPREGQRHCLFGGEVFDQQGRPVLTP